MPLENFEQPHPRSSSKQGSLHSSERIQSFFSDIASRYDFANHLLSGGSDFYWRWRAARIVRKWSPTRILDLASGSGDLALALNRACPGTTLIAADFCEPMLRKAQEKGVRALVAADGLRLPFPDNSFDALTIAFGLRNMSSWPTALAEFQRVLRPGGRLLILDFSQPRALFGTIYRWYLNNILPRVASVVTGHKGAYTYLADSIAAFPSPESLSDLLKEAGYANVTATPLTGRIVAIHTGKKRPREG
jgi:demethylmenaquinone methyltransferase/2-methoxy-6-polyprenyl-1,4-benzoquinol methylase